MFFDRKILCNGGDAAVTVGHTHMEPTDDKHCTRVEQYQVHVREDHVWSHRQQTADTQVESRGTTLLSV